VGMPAVSMAAVRRSLPRDLDAGYGDVVACSDVFRSRHGFLTANNQTPYVCTVFDLDDGPMVLAVPPASEKVALFGSAIDSWEVPLADLGPTGEDGGHGGRYVFLPPGQDRAPSDEYFVVPSPTRFVHIALRPITRGTGTLADAAAYGRTLRTYRFDEAEDPPPTRYVDASRSSGTPCRVTTSTFCASSPE
jgi:hypothetical protein